MTLKKDEIENWMKIEIENWNENNILWDRNRVKG